MRSLWGWPIGLAVVVAVIIGVVAATGDDNKNTTTSSPPPTSTTNSGSDTSTSKSPTQADKVTIENMSFSPEHITVKKGTTVTWTNKDSVTHTVSADSAGGPNSENLENGETYSFTFDAVGTFGYHCNIHQTMHGTVTVTE